MICENIQGIWTAKGRVFNGHILELVVFLDGEEFTRPDPQKAFKIKQEFDKFYLISTETFNNRSLFPRFLLVSK
jgi:hypothetical protein